mmetsp:Transcript_15125/g.22142  ORF Transcript_15125/g.22142 Transcript_15125/m.22142 type:complete len:143 (+) Transcript_15125:183-611(+)|eukprot:CAMPEP_0197243350 /NCGR_PEP_ID=MMETSP1429-20130617/8837_1 /TAXON_ID=49237 /ORGANISM="Chaetoceros  sp., Strain UNC1202" /LENGTH=142 /DNA_ID=CAMNT_0042703563 /DNA_START=191 /DNA_END=619 /DNA_ORIENTATION=+
MDQSSTDEHETSSSSSHQTTTTHNTSAAPQNENQGSQTNQEADRRKRVILKKIISKTAKAIMNAAVTIFSVGVGVGLILGDYSFQSDATNVDDSHNAGDPRSSRDTRTHADHGRGDRENSSPSDASVVGANTGSPSYVLPAQ